MTPVLKLSELGLLSLTGAVRSSGDGIAICIDTQDAEERVAYAEIVVWRDRQWQRVARVGWRAVGVCSSGEEWIVLGARGEVLVVNGDQCTQERLGNAETDPPASGHMTCIRNVCGVVYAVGMRRQIYSRAAAQGWVRQDEGVRRISSSEGVVGFQSIAGYADDEMYACGWRGEIWRKSGSVWSRVEAPTNLVLADICCAGDGFVYAVGQRGHVVRGRGDVWSVLEHGGPREDFWGVVWHEGSLLVSSLYAVFRLDQGRLERLDMGDVDMQSHYHLSAEGPSIWSIGLRSILAKDGPNAWRALS